MYYFTLTNYFQENPPRYSITVPLNGGHTNLSTLCEISHLRGNTYSYYVLECDRHSWQAMNKPEILQILKRIETQ